jgi:hypothetical protein
MESTTQDQFMFVSVGSEFVFEASIKNERGEHLGYGPGEQKYIKTGHSSVRDANGTTRVVLGPCATVYVFSRTAENPIDALFAPPKPNLLAALRTISYWSPCQCAEAHGDNHNCCVLVAEKAIALATGDAS